MNEAEFIRYRIKAQKDSNKHQASAFRKGLLVGFLIALVSTCLASWAIVSWN